MQEEGGADATEGARTTRRIAVMRHGKAEQAGRTDFERSLADRGHDDSEDTGAWLEREGFRPDRVLVSAAARTIDTWESVARGGGWTIEPDLSEVLYGAGPETALDLVRESPAEVSAVLVIGHNPTMASLASILDDGEGDPDVASDMMSGYPTSAVALFEYDGDWADLHESGARLVGYYVGRG